jgi:HEAT repeat protein
LARIGEPAVAPLAQALGDRNDQVRRAAVKGLAGIGEPALAALAEALGDKDEDIRQEAIEGLTCIGEPALFPLVGALGHEDEGIRQKAEEGLVRIGEPALAPLVEALSHESAIVRQAAASILGQIGDDRAIEPLLQVLDGDDGDDVLRVVADALAALGWQPGENAVVALYWLYREEWEQIVSLLGEDAVDLIRKALREGDWLARRSATRMLGQYGESAVELLVGLLADTDGDVRQAAAEELKKLNWQPGEDADAASYWVALGEWDRASRLGQVAVVPLIDKRWQVSEEEQEAIMEALVQTGEPVAESLIAELVTSGQWGHAALVATLGQLGDPRAAEPLCQELRAEDGVVRRVAAEALGSLADRLPSSSLARRVARALWWRLTDWRFEEDELEPIWDVAQAAHYSLGQVSARLTELAVANLPFDDPTRPGP